MADAIAHADAVFAGQVVSIEPGNAPAGELTARVIFLSGKRQGMSTPSPTQDGLLRGKLIVPDAGIAVEISAGDGGEQAPQAGHSYIFCVQGDAQRGVSEYVALKIVPATPEGIANLRGYLDRLGRHSARPCAIAAGTAPAPQGSKPESICAPRAAY